MTADATIPRNPPRNALRALIPCKLGSCRKQFKPTRKWSAFCCQAHHDEYWQLFRINDELEMFISQQIGADWRDQFWHWKQGGGQ
jgi:hypothetical protein